MNQTPTLQSILPWIDAHLMGDIHLDQLASAAGYSPSQFHVLFAHASGHTPAAYIRNRRLALACWELAFSKRSILDIALRYHFSSQEAFTRAFMKRYGLPPGRFRSRAHAKTDRPIEGAKSMSSNPFPESKILEGVQRVGFYQGGDQSPEDIPFPSCLASLLRYIGEDYPWLPFEEHAKIWRLNYANVHFLGATGMAFGILWRAGWSFDNADLLYVADPREVIRRAFLAAGYGYEIVEKSGAPEDEQLFKDRIMASIQRGVPVLAFGVIGPPECCLITGYEDHANTLSGWNYFQEVPPFADGAAIRADGYFAKSNWFENTWNLIVVGEKQAPFDTSLSNREMLRWAIRVIRTPESLGRRSGLAAFDAWRAHILDETQFAGIDDDTLRQRHEVHHSAIGLVAECRFAASQFLQHIAAEEPAIEQPLRQAARDMKSSHDLMWEMWALCGGNPNPDAWQIFKERKVRLKLAGLIDKAKALDEGAALKIESALVE